MNMLTLLAIEAASVMKALEIMWKGVVAIFLVIALIVIVTKIVNKICVSADERRKEKEEEKAKQNEQNQ